MINCLIRGNYFRSSNLNSNNKQEIYGSNKPDSNIDLEQVKNENLYFDCNNYHTETIGVHFFRNKVVHSLYIKLNSY